MEYTLADALKSVKLKARKETKTIKFKKFKPKEHQLKTLGKALRKLRFGDYSDAGTGKSFTSYMYLSAVILGGRKAVAVMPPGLTEQFLETFHELMDIKSVGITAHVLNETPAKRQSLYKIWDKEGWPDLLVLGYQMFLRDGGKYIINKGYDTFIADEAHHLKSARSKTSKLFKLFIKHAKDPRVLLMTGTPMPTTPECAYGVVSVVTPDAYRSKASFDRKHLVKTHVGNFNMTVGFKNLDLLSDNLYLSAIRVTKEEVLDLRKPNVINVDVKMSKEHNKLYKSLIEERLLEFDGEVIPAIQSQTLRRYAMQVASNPNAYSDKTIPSNTLGVLSDILDSIGVVKFKKDQKLYSTGQMTKVLIFAHYTDTIKMLEEFLTDLNPAVIDGSHNTAKNKKKFIEDETCRVVIVQPQSGAAGLDGFQHVCHNVVFFEPVPSPGIFDQAASRLIRSGQSKVVNVYVFNVKGTVFSKAINVMLGRASDVKKVVIKVGDLLNELLGQ